VAFNSVGNLNLKFTIGTADASKALDKMRHQFAALGKAAADFNAKAGKTFGLYPGVRAQNFKAVEQALNRQVAIVRNALPQAIDKSAKSYERAFGKGAVNTAGRVWQAHTHGARELQKAVESVRKSYDKKIPSGGIPLAGRTATVRPTADNPLGLGAFTPSRFQGRFAATGAAIAGRRVSTGGEGFLGRTARTFFDFPGRRSEEDRRKHGFLGKDSFADKFGKGVFDTIKSFPSAAAGSVIGLITKIGQALVFAGGAAAFFAGRMAANIFNEALETSGRWEKLAITFESMTGSAAKSVVLLRQIENMAQRLPLSVGSISRGVQGFIAGGFSPERAVQFTESFAALAATANVGLTEAMDRIVLAVTQIQGKGKVMAQEMRQLAELGVPAWAALAERLTKFLGVQTSVADAMRLVEEGMVDSAIGINALLDLAAKRGDLLKKQAGGLLGLRELFGTAKELLLRDVGNLLVEGSGIKDFLREMIDLSNQVRKGLGGWSETIKGIGAAVRGVFDSFVALCKLSFNTFVEPFKQSQMSVNDWRDAAIEAVKLVTAAAVKFVQIMAGALAELAGAAELISDIVGGGGNLARYFGIGTKQGERTLWADIADSATFVATGQMPTGRGALPGQHDESAFAAIRRRAAALRDMDPSAIARALDAQKAANRVVKAPPGGPLADPAFRGVLGGVLAGQANQFLGGILGRPVDIGKAAQELMAAAKLQKDAAARMKEGEQLAANIRRELRPESAQFLEGVNFLRASSAERIGEKGLSPEDMAVAVGKRFQDFADKADKEDKSKLPAAVTAGSKEAAAAVNKFLSGRDDSRDPMKRMADIMERETAQRRRWTDIGQTILDSIRDGKLGGPVVVLP
jgi:tape measure domain-containing protein